MRDILRSLFPVFLLLGTFCSSFTAQLANLLTVDKVTTIHWLIAVFGSLGAAIGALVALYRSPPGTESVTGRSATPSTLRPQPRRDDGNALVQCLLSLAVLVLLAACSMPKANILSKVNGGFDATDNKVLGVLPVEQVEAVTDKIGLTGFRKFEEQLQDMQKLYKSMPVGTDLFVELRSKSTGALLPWDDLTIKSYMQWSTDVTLPVPDAGSRVTLRMVSPQVTRPAQVVPVVTNSAGAVVPVEVITNTIHSLQGANNAGMAQ